MCWVRKKKKKSRLKIAENSRGNDHLNYIRNGVGVIISVLICDLNAGMYREALMREKMGKV